MKSYKNKDLDDAEVQKRLVERVLRPDLLLRVGLRRLV